MSRLTRRRSWRGPASVRRPSRLVRIKPDGAARPASRDSHACTPSAALASARGPWPRSLASDPLGGLARVINYARPPCSFFGTLRAFVVFVLAT